MKEELKQIATQIKAARITAGLTQVACAERLGCKQQHIQQAETKGVISLYLLSKLARVLNCEFIIK